MEPWPRLALVLLLGPLADGSKAAPSKEFTVKDIVYLHPSTTPYPGGFKCFTCEKATDNYDCNRWAPDVYCPRGLHCLLPGQHLQSATASQRFGCHLRHHVSHQPRRAAGAPPGPDRLVSVRLAGAFVLAMPRRGVRRPSLAVERTSWGRLGWGSLPGDAASPGKQADSLQESGGLRCSATGSVIWKEVPNA
ncbi:ly6/PLAUR domain-containing protein 6 isoform X2 [Tachyglossus aculeatus]|uniref:ly6/PLAUR domain-containing protein 6 isoform X2 n=1 Tax=Tachyglossus aculeatus TaxID=9261 RepID=UPI0018F6DF0F|nr:ly6/PLAUR domain-containing protein 6 isoform X2 [Tachyglossus aculeatus]